MRGGEHVFCRFQRVEGAGPSRQANGSAGIPYSRVDSPRPIMEKLGSVGLGPALCAMSTASSWHYASCTAIRPTREKRARALMAILFGVCVSISTYSETEAVA